MIRRAFTVMTAQRVIRKVTRFIALSPTIAQHFSDWIGLEKTRISVIPHPIDTDFFRPDQEAEGISRRELNLQGPYILFVGRLDPRKNVRTLLRAVAELHTRPTTVIVGDGKERESLMSLAKHIGVDSCTRFLGPVPAHLLPGLYSGAEFVVLPSLSEMSPMTVIEALSCGTPVVATNLAVLRDIITNGRNGLLISPTPESLSNAIAILTSDSDLKKKMGERARRGVLETNSLGAVADQLLQIYHDASAS
jgi:glycosyltransferase involved in cell wall biosynthesis